MFKAPILLLTLAGLLTACGGSDLLSDSTGDLSTDRFKVYEPPSASPITDDHSQTPVTGPVLLQWSRPALRENGEYLEGDDIGGYELRYREVGLDGEQVVLIDDGWVESYQVERLENAYDFAIAVYDRDGLYSEFVALQPL